MALVRINVLCMYFVWFHSQDRFMLDEYFLPQFANSSCGLKKKTDRLLLCFCGNGRCNTAVLQLCDADTCLELFNSFTCCKCYHRAEFKCQFEPRRVLWSVHSASACVTGIPEQHSRLLSGDPLSLTLGSSPTFEWTPTLGQKLHSEQITMTSALFELSL
jgi:hypothetical protein